MLYARLSRYDSNECPRSPRSPRPTSTLFATSPAPLRRLQGARPEARPDARQAVDRAARPVQRSARRCPARPTTWPPTGSTSATTAAAGSAGAARAAGAALRRRAGAGGPRRQLQPGADARRGRLRAAQGHRRQPAAVVAGAARRVSVPGARLRPPLRDLPGLRHRDDPRAAGDDGPDMDAVERLVAADPRSRACGACRSTATRPARSTRRRPRAARGDADRRARLPPVLGQRLRRASPDRRAHRDPNMLEACARHGHPHRAFVFGSTSKITLAGAGFALFAGSTETSPGI